MSWLMFWAVLGVVVGTLLLVSPLLYISMRREVRKALRETASGPSLFEPLSGGRAALGQIDSIQQKLDRIDALLDRTHGHIERAGLCVDHEGTSEGGRSRTGS